MKKGLFHHFYRAFIKANKTIFLEGESPTLKTLYLHSIDDIAIVHIKIIFWSIKTRQQQINFEPNISKERSKRESRMTQNFTWNYPVVLKRTYMREIHCTKNEVFH